MDLRRRSVRTPLLNDTLHCQRQGSLNVHLSSLNPRCDSRSIELSSLSSDPTCLQPTLSFHSNPVSTVQLTSACKQRKLPPRTHQPPPSSPSTPQLTPLLVSPSPSAKSSQLHRSLQQSSSPHSAIASIPPSSLRYSALWSKSANPLLRSGSFTFDSF